MPETEFPLNPRLRPIEAFPVRMNNQDYVCLRDPQSLANQPIFLNKKLVFIVSRMNGSNSLRDIQLDYCRSTGEILPMEVLESIVEQLDEKHYLDSQSFQDFYEGLVREFRDATTRPAYHAGSAYEKSHEALVSQILSFFAPPEGPGTVFSPDHSEPLRGLIAPHIDFLRGGPTYAHAYKALADKPGTDTFVIFGTCHTPMQQRFALTLKDYETPLGPAMTDQDFVRSLAARARRQYLSDEFSHRGEHSIEFQTVCLKYVLGDKPFKIVPILVGSFHDLYSNGKTAAENPEIQNVVDALTETIEEAAVQVCVIAGADLAHVGRRFGDASGPTECSLREVQSEDRIFLRLVEAGDAEGLFQSIAADNDRRRVCGFPPIYMTLRCLKETQGRLLQYRQWSDFEAGAAVTFAAVALY